MMNVTDVNKITSTISYLRSNVYNKDTFKNTFCQLTNNYIPVDSINFIAEQYGGWSVYINSSINIPHDGISNIITIIKNTLIAMGDTVVSPENITVNIADVVMTGNTSMMIKL